MTQSVKTAITLAVLLAMLVGGAYVGYRQLTQPLPAPPKVEAQGPCEDVAVASGDPVRPGMVTVSVFNASARNGLADKTLGQFEDAGFGRGETGNVESVQLRRAQVWTSTPRDPAALLVHGHLGTKRSKLVVVPAKRLQGVGVMVVVGDKMDALVQGPKRVISRVDATVCSPVEVTDPELQ